MDGSLAEHWNASGTAAGAWNALQGALREGAERLLLLHSRRGAAGE